MTTARCAAVRRLVDPLPVLADYLMVVGPPVARDGDLRVLEGYPSHRRGRLSTHARAHYLAIYRESVALCFARHSCPHARRKVVVVVLDGVPAASHSARR